MKDSILDQCNNEQELENEVLSKKPKTFIQWVAEHAPSGSPVRIDETRIFNRLFKSDVVPKDFKADIAPNSLETVQNALIETGFWPLAKRAMAEARKEAEVRTSKVTTENPEGAHSAKGDTPVATTDQLLGNECVRFQGLRVAYFALDKDARIAALAKGSAYTRREQGDYIVLNRIVSLKEDSGKT